LVAKIRDGTPLTNEAPPQTDEMYGGVRAA
jgi:hypothetical protein